MTGQQHDPNRLKSCKKWRPNRSGPRTSFKQFPHTRHERQVGGRHRIPAEVRRTDPGMALPFLGDNLTNPASAQVERHQKVKFLVIVRSKMKRLE
jgi:hypothetical protein